MFTVFTADKVVPECGSRNCYANIANRLRKAYIDRQFVLCAYEPGTSFGAVEDDEMKYRIQEE